MYSYTSLTHLLYGCMPICYGSANFNVFVSSGEFGIVSGVRVCDSGRCWISFSSVMS